MIVGSLSCIIDAAAIQPVEHVTDGLNRLPLQFIDQPNVLGVLTALITPMQALDNTIAQIILQRSVNLATGVTLTMLGKLVGKERLGITDDTIFKAYVRGQILSNKSTGRFEDLIAIAVVVLNNSSYTITLLNEGLATARIKIAGLALTDAVADVLIALLEPAVAAANRLVIQWSNASPVTTFTLDAGPGLDSGHLASASG